MTASDNVAGSSTDRIIASRRRFLVGSAVLAGAAMLPAVASPAAASTGLPAGGAPPAGAGKVLDTVVLGDAASESAHKLGGSRNVTTTGLLDQPARRMQPAEQAGVFGGTLQVTMAVDPKQPVYVSIKLDGTEAAEELGRLMLICDGKQVGYYHLGAVDPLDIADAYPRLPGRFYYHTIPLPTSLTAGKTSVVLEVRSMGPIYAYGLTTDTFYKNLESDTRAVYRLYTHVDPYLAPAGDDVQGAPVLNSDLPVRDGPGEELLDDVRSAVNSRLNNWLTSKNPEWIWPGATAYLTEWTDLYRNPAVIDAIAAGMDKVAADHASGATNPEDAGWLGYGRSARGAFMTLADWGARLDEQVGDTTRRESYVPALVASRDYWRMNRRGYTNQGMIVDLGIWYCNQLLAGLGSDQAWPEEDALRYLREATGMQPWRGSDTADGGSEMNLGENYLIVSKTGLAKELGYVGNYGDEVVGWAHEIFLATENAELRAQCRLIMRARGPFRYPLQDEGGFRSFTHNQLVGWRDHAYPGKVTYALNTTAGVSPLMPIDVDDPATAGWCRQMVDDNQVFHSVQTILSNGGSGPTMVLLGVPDQYEKAKNATGAPLPMTDGQPDFVWADTDCGIVSAKHGDVRVYASLWWRARYAVNNLARFHVLTPQQEHLATVRQQTVHTDSGTRYTIPDQVNFEFGDGGPPPPGDQPGQAFAGEELVVAEMPAGVDPPTAENPENMFAGKSQFYRAQYGPYLVAMNCTTDRSFDVELPRGTVTDVATGRKVGGGKLSLRADSAVVLHIG